MDKRTEIIKKIESIPSIPVYASKAIKLLQNPERDMNEVIRIIEHDPAITVNVLKLVNSSSFSAIRKISSIREAAVRLGATNLLQMLIGSSMTVMMNRPLKGYLLPSGELWRSSVSTAIYTDILGETLRLELPGHTFTAGLLRDIGKLVLASFVEVDSEEISSFATKHKQTFTEAERDVLGIDHAEAGAILLNRWHLPEELEVPVRWHHRPEKSEEMNLVTTVVHIADALTIMEGIGAGCEGLNYRYSDKAAEKLGLTLDLIEMIICRAQLKREEIKDIFLLGDS